MEWYFWIAIIAIIFLIARFVWKNVRRGIVFIVIAIAALWLLRALAPANWSRLIEWTKALIGTIWR